MAARAVVREHLEAHLAEHDGACGVALGLDRHDGQPRLPGGDRQGEQEAVEGDVARGDALAEDLGQAAGVVAEHDHLAEARGVERLDVLGDVGEVGDRRPVTRSRPQEAMAGLLVGVPKERPGPSEPITTAVGASATSSIQPWSTSKRASRSVRVSRSPSPARRPNRRAGAAAVTRYSLVSWVSPGIETQSVDCVKGR